MKVNGSQSLPASLDLIVDPCDSNPCSLDSSCLAKNGSFVCLCSDKTPVPRNGSCSDHRSPNVSSNNSGVFPKEVLIEMLNQGVTTTTTTTSTSEPPTANASSESISPVATGIIALGVICLGVLGLVLYALRHRLHLNGCPGAKDPRCPSPMKHAPLSPRYAANPNYYTSAHEGSLLHILKNLEIRREKLLFCREIGEGCFGKVYKGELRQGDGSVVPVAVKVLKENASPEAEADFHREVEIMSTFSHDNILQLLGVVTGETGTMPWMVFEYMEHGDLAELLRRSNPHLSTEGEAVCKLDKDCLMWIAIQVAAGMLYLSQHHFVHRDLATRNCLVGHNLVVKISDFGMSRDIYTCDYYKIGGSRLLPVRWMAPESIMYGKFTLESDVWSFGVLLWEVYTHGKQPYYGHSNEEVVKLILQGILLSRPADCPSCVCSIMYGCWRTEPFNRLTFFDIHQQLTEQSVDLANSPLINQTSSIDKDNYLIPRHFHHIVTS